MEAVFEGRRNRLVYCGKKISCSCHVIKKAYFECRRY